MVGNDRQEENEFFRAEITGAERPVRPGRRRSDTGRPDGPVPGDPEYRTAAPNRSWASASTYPWIRLVWPAHSFSRSSNFWVFPVDVRGSSSTNAMAPGTLKRAMWVFR